MDLKEALAALGDDADMVARTLRQKGIRGKKCWPTRCPIARYLQAACRTEFVTVGRRTAITYPGELLSFALRGRQQENLPQAVSDFTRRFDHEGMYPYLEDKS